MLYDLQLEHFYRLDGHETLSYIISTKDEQLLCKISGSLI